MNKIYCFDSSRQIRKEDIGLKGKKELKLCSLRGGHDFGQIALDADADLTYFVKIGDLQSDVGAVFASDNIALYYEKTILIDRNWQKNGMPVGNYPDALIPVTASVLNDVNSLKKNERGTILVDVTVPYEQKAGKYRGKVFISGDIQAEINISVDVFSSEVRKYNTSKCLFPYNCDVVKRYEGKCDSEMIDAYNTVYENNRVSSTIVDTKSAKTVKEWAKYVFLYLKGGKNSYTIPEMQNVVDGQAYIDSRDLKDRLVAIAEESLINDENVVNRLFFYDWIIDEPFLSNIPDGKVAKQIKLFDDAVLNAVRECSEKKEFDCERGREIIQSIKDFPHVITDYANRFNEEQKIVKNEDGTPFIYPIDRISLCPQFDGYDGELRHLYDKQKERWFYGCNAPNAPFPGYHIDDAGYSARIIGYLMAEYDVVGNLYWLTNYSQEVNTTGSPLFLDNPYEIAHRGLGANGEGCLIYPGKLYGIIGPVETIRLKRIRQGNEEYEILRDLIVGYRGYGLNIKPLIYRMLSNIVDGMKIEWKFDGFEKIRVSFLNLYELFNLYGLTMTLEKVKSGYKYTVDSKANFTAYIKNKQVGKSFVLPIKHGFSPVVIKIKGKKYPIYLNNNIDSKIILHETLYNNGAFSGDIQTIKINYHPIYREVNIKPNVCRPEITVDTLTDLSEYEGVGILVNVRKTGRYCIKNCDKTVKTGVFTKGWNRIDIVGGLRGRLLSLRLNNDKEIGFGELYFRV